MEGCLPGAHARQRGQLCGLPRRPGHPHAHEGHPRLGGRQTRPRSSPYRGLQYGHGGGAHGLPRRRDARRHRQRRPAREEGTAAAQAPDTNTAAHLEHDPQAAPDGWDGHDTPTARHQCVHSRHESEGPGHWRRSRGGRLRNRHEHLYHWVRRPRRPTGCGRRPHPFRVRPQGQGRCAQNGRQIVSVECRYGDMFGGPSATRTAASPAIVYHSAGGKGGGQGTGVGGQSSPCRQRTSFRSRGGNDRSQVV
mmetsp:Transcript_16664/g.30255  ORF Transcript_16664/g.30255 Transcript_16664/m.30255 type:complete len:250 (-) Transcript_16664:351-1100(-)